MKRQTKKLASFLLALVMAFALATTVFAADGDGPGSTPDTPPVPETGSITVENPQADQIYTAYKIFDVAYDKDKAAYSYTISGTSKWFNVVAAKGDDGTVTSNITGLTFTKAYSEDTYVVSEGDGFNAPAFAKTLKANISGKTGNPLEKDATSGKPVVDGLDLGYYFVTSTSGAMCNLTTTNPDVTIRDKNDVPFEKTDDKESVEVGETVSYTISGKVPDTTEFTAYTYEIADTMSEGLTFNQSSVKVQIDGNDLTAGTDYTVTCNVNNNANSFKVNIDVMNQQAKVGKAITVTYSAVVNEKAVAVISKNHAELKYSNDPTDGSKTTTTPPDEEDVYSSKIVIDKYALNAQNKEDTSKKLAGAQFVLYKEATTKKYYKYIEASGTEKAKVEWVDHKADATVKTTDDNGEESFDGLKDGTYYLEEIAAPDGYNILTAPVEVTVAGSSTEAASLSVVKGVANSTGTLLPGTGGMGTTIFYILGSVLAIGAVVLLIVKKRMNSKR